MRYWYKAYLFKMLKYQSPFLYAATNWNTEFK